MLKKPDADHEIYECGCHAPSLPLKCAYWPSFFLSPTHFSYPGPAFDSGGEGHIQKLPSWIPSLILPLPRLDLASSAVRAHGC